MNAGNKSGITDFCLESGCSEKSEEKCLNECRCEDVECLLCYQNKHSVTWYLFPKIYISCHFFQFFFPIFLPPLPPPYPLFANTIKKQKEFHLFLHCHFLLPLCSSVNPKIQKIMSVVHGEDEYLNSSINVR